jgi:TRAP-type C4-dicarboxylate transport system permease small subunit
VQALVIATAPRHIKLMRIVKTLIVIALFALLAGSLWYAYDFWAGLGSTDIPGWMYGAMAGGVVFSLLVGCGLMGLVFYSSRHGYDDRASSGDFDG